jgi:hypothetical protein
LNGSILGIDLDPKEANWHQVQQQRQQRLQHYGLVWQSASSLFIVSQGLKDAGESLCAALPTRCFCNNPACRNAAGVSAGFALVRGAACVCGGCVGSAGAAGAAAAPQEAVAAR